MFKKIKDKANEAVYRLNNHHDLSIVQEYRGLHLKPMIKLKYFVIQELERLQIKHLFVSARLKMMTTILDKIETGRHKKLSTMQDLGGARVVFDNAEDLYTYYDELLKSKAFKIVRTKDYIKEPKETGYRGIHIIYDINGYNIELQLRTEGQHIWATTVETVGWYLKQDLKSGRGDLKWIEFFQLTSILIYYHELQFYNIEAFTKELKVVQNFKINDVNAIQFLEDIHYSCHLYDFRSEDAEKRSIFGIDAYHSPSNRLCIYSYSYIKGFRKTGLPLELWDKNEKFFLISLNRHSLKWIPPSKNCLYNPIIGFDSEDYAHVVYQNRERECEMVSLLFTVNVMGSGTLQHAYPFLFLDTGRFTNYITWGLQSMMEVRNDKNLRANEEIH